MRTVLYAATLAALTVAACKQTDLPIGSEGFLLVEQCTCDGTGTTLFADPNYYLGAVGEAAACDGGPSKHDLGTNDCPTGGTCTPDCHNTGGGDECGGGTPPSS